MSTRPCFGPALKRLDLLLHREVLRLRAAYQLSLDEFRGLYISDEQVDALVRDEAERPSLTPDALSAEAESLTALARDLLDADERWSHLVQEFQLDHLERELLVFALAPELALKYETLYGYLNNDVTRKYPTVELALRLFGSGSLAHTEQNQALRRALSPAATLFRERLFEPNTDGSRVSLALGFRPSATVASYLLGLPTVPLELERQAVYHAPSGPDWDALGIEAPRVGELAELARSFEASRASPWVLLRGEVGSGRRRAAHAALSATGRGLFALDLSALLAEPKAAAAELARLVLRARLERAGIFVRGLEACLTHDAREAQACGGVLARLAEAPVPVLFAVVDDAACRPWLRQRDLAVVALGEPGPDAREALWRRALAAAGLGADGTREVAARFALNAGQIRAAVAMLGRRQGAGTNGQVPPRIAESELYASAREQSVGEVGKLAQKVTTSQRWEELILPASTLERVQELLAAIRHRTTVYGDWGLRAGSGGTGILALFAGASGTGKTMTASLIAGQLGLDLYRIDLSSVVSKYIGETEKNLDRIFAAARRANCLLFFDEADALFGKRSEVRDAHDRYANIEVAYLLQKIELHDGVVMLASNLAKNMDPAFSRRIHYSLEFPRPAAADRERLWRGMFGARAPLAEDVDFAFLGRQFDVTGGEIRTMALDAAMLAASGATAITMATLVRAVGRHLVKQGRIPASADFKQHFGLLGEAAARNREQRA